MVMINELRVWVHESTAIKYNYEAVKDISIILRRRRSVQAQRALTTSTFVSISISFRNQLIFTITSSLDKCAIAFELLIGFHLESTILLFGL